MSNPELKEFIRTLVEEAELAGGLDESPLEDASLAYQRRVLRGKRDAVRAELQRRLSEDGR